MVQQLGLGALTAKGPSQFREPRSHKPHSGQDKKKGFKWVSQGLNQGLSQPQL